MRVKDIPHSPRYRELDVLFEYGKRNYGKMPVGNEVVNCVGRWKMWKQFCVDLLRADKFEEFDGIIRRMQQMRYAQYPYDRERAIYFVINGEYK